MPSAMPQPSRAPPDPLPMLIGDAWHASNATLDSINPANGVLNHRVAAATSTEVDRAVLAATAAAAAPAWRDLLPHRRAALLHAIGAAIDARAEPFARLQMLENGKVLAECRRAGRRARPRSFATTRRCARRWARRVTPARGDYLSMTRARAVRRGRRDHAVELAADDGSAEGRAGARGRQRGHSQALGDHAVGGARARPRRARRPVLPPGILNVLPGTGSVAGDALVRASRRELGVVHGRHGERAPHREASPPKKLMPVALELGGKSPHIVFADADLDAAVAAVAAGIFEGSGQSCVAGSRLFVQRSRAGDGARRAASSAHAR